MSKCTLFTLLTAAFLAGPAQAGSFSDVVRGRLLTGWTNAAGHHVAGIRLELAEGWKTYWRSPGEIGIPPQFDWTGSRNLARVDVHWPVPRVFDDLGGRSIGYAENVTIPLDLVPATPGAPLHLEGTMSIGVCREVCVPVTLALRASLPAGRETSGAEMIRAAMANLPRSAEEADVASVTCRVEPIADGLRVTVTAELPAMRGPEEAVLEHADPSVWTSQAQIRRQGRRLEAVAEMVPPEAAPFALSREAVRLTVLSPAGAVDIQGCSAE